MSNTTKIEVAFKEAFKDNLFAIISIGSLTTKHYLKKWSDIDLLVVLNNLTIYDKIKLSEIKKRLEKAYQCNFGMNVITKKEATKPVLPEIFLDGKTLQGFFDLHSHPKRLIYCEQKNTRFFVPDKKLVRVCSLNNIAMFLLRNRKTLTYSFSANINKLKSIVEKEIRASFIITKLAVQYKNQECDGRVDTISKAEKIFPNFDFSALKHNEKNIRKWDKINSKQDLLNILQKTDEYIESFSKLIQENL